MKLLSACFQARFDSFTVKSKSRRTSARSRKTNPTTAAWPLNSPVPYDLAYAGFVWKPTTASPDNVQCFACNCQLDGWEPADVPAFEHLTHSPNCGFAINVCIRLRIGDPNRVEEDPLSEKMKEARRTTFGNMWPLDAAAGFPSVEQMVEAGWYYDPSPELPDGVTCPYCSLSLDSWDAGDDPLEEHRRRQDACLFFALKELYHPESIPFTSTSVVQKQHQEQQPKQQPKATATKGKRVSSRSSTTKKAAPKTTAKAPARSTRSKKAAISDVSDVGTEASHDNSNDTNSNGNKNKPLPEIPVDSSLVSEIPVEQFVVKSVPAKPASKKGKAPAKPRKASNTRGTKRKSEDLEKNLDNCINYTTDSQEEIPNETRRESKRTKRLSSPPEASDRLDWPTFSLPESAIASTPKHTPEAVKASNKWAPIDIDAAMEENLPSPALKDLSSPEKQMTIEEWYLDLGKKQEQRFRDACFQQITTLEAEGRRALAVIDNL